MGRSRQWDWQRLEDDKAALHYRTAKPEEERTCLSCRKRFMSFGKMNRICDRCKENENYRYGGWVSGHRVLPK